MAIHQGGTGLPEDRVVNTFHFFDVPTAYATHAPAAAAAVQAFFAGIGLGPLGQTQAIEAYLSPWLSGIWETRTYNLEDPKPRVPLIHSWTQGSFGSGVGLPEEVACCASFHGAPPATARRRGRVFVGPLRMAAVSLPTSAGDRSRPSPDFIADLAKAMQTLLVNAPTWCIRSHLPSENFVPVVGGFVDNALDTQRRRGPAASARTVWTPVAV